jgi:hypothetical protein
MVPRITEEQRKAIEAHPGEPVRLEDGETKRVYILVEESQAPQLYEQWLRHQLQQGFDAADRGETVDWDPERIKSEGRRRLSEMKPGA